jgi:hypothetical protein
MIRSRKTNYSGHVLEEFSSGSWCFLRTVGAEVAARYPHEVDQFVNLNNMVESPQLRLFK